MCRSRTRSFLVGDIQGSRFFNNFLAEILAEVRRSSEIDPATKHNGELPLQTGKCKTRNMSRQKFYEDIKIALGVRVSVQARSKQRKLLHVESLAEFRKLLQPYGV